MKALPIREPQQGCAAPLSEACNRTETWMMVMLIGLVPALGGALFQCHIASLQRARLAKELTESRTMVRDVVNELVETKGSLASRESQVERLIDATTLADNEMRQLRGAVFAWQRQHATLSQASSRQIAELSAYSADVERKLGESQQVQEAERQRMEEDMMAMRNQLAATGYELRETQNFAREAALWNEQLEHGVRSLQSNNRSLSQTLSSTQSALSSAQSAATNAQSEADSAEAQRDRARRALGRAEGAIVALKNEVVQQRREEVREHNMGLVRPPAVEQPPAHSEPPKPPPPAAPQHRDPPGGKGRR